MCVSEVVRAPRNQTKHTDVIPDTAATAIAATAIVAITDIAAAIVVEELSILLLLGSGRGSGDVIVSAIVAARFSS